MSGVGLVADSVEDERVDDGSALSSTSDDEDCLNDVDIEDDDDFDSPTPSATQLASTADRARPAAVAASASRRAASTASTRGTRIISLNWSTCVDGSSTTFTLHMDDESSELLQRAKCVVREVCERAGRVLNTNAGASEKDIEHSLIRFFFGSSSDVLSAVIQLICGSSDSAIVDAQKFIVDTLTGMGLGMSRTAADQLGCFDDNTFLLDKATFGKLCGFAARQRMEASPADRKAAESTAAQLVIQLQRRCSRSFTQIGGVLNDIVTLDDHKHSFRGHAGGFNVSMGRKNGSNVELVTDMVSSPLSRIVQVMRTRLKGDTDASNAQKLLKWRKETGATAVVDYALDRAYSSAAMRNAIVGGEGAVIATIKNVGDTPHTTSARIARRRGGEFVGEKGSELLHVSTRAVKDVHGVNVGYEAMVLWRNGHKSVVQLAYSMPGGAASARIVRDLAHSWAVDYFAPKPHCGLFVVNGDADGTHAIALEAWLESAPISLMTTGQSDRAWFILRRLFVTSMAARSIFSGAGRDAAIVGDERCVMTALHARVLTVADDLLHKSSYDESDRTRLEALEMFDLRTILHRLGVATTTGTSRVTLAARIISTCTQRASEAPHVDDSIGSSTVDSADMKRRVLKSWFMAPADTRRIEALRVGHENEPRAVENVLAFACDNQRWFEDPHQRRDSTAPSETANFDLLQKRSLGKFTAPNCFVVSGVGLAAPRPPTTRASTRIQLGSAVESTSLASRPTLATSVDALIISPTTFSVMPVEVKTATTPQTQAGIARLAESHGAVFYVDLGDAFRLQSGEDDDDGDDGGDDVAIGGGDVSRAELLRRTFAYVTLNGQVGHIHQLLHHMAALTSRTGMLAYSTALTGAILFAVVLVDTRTRRFTTAYSSLLSRIVSKHSLRIEDIVKMETRQLKALCDVAKVDVAALFTGNALAAMLYREYLRRLESAVAASGPLAQAPLNRMRSLKPLIVARWNRSKAGVDQHSQRIVGATQRTNVHVECMLLNTVLGTIVSNIRQIVRILSNQELLLSSTSYNQFTQRLSSRMTLGTYAFGLAKSAAWLFGIRRPQVATLVVSPTKRAVTVLRDLNDARFQGGAREHLCVRMHRRRHDEGESHERYLHILRRKSWHSLLQVCAAALWDRNAAPLLQTLPPAFDGRP